LEPDAGRLPQLAAHVRLVASVLAARALCSLCCISRACVASLAGFTASSSTAHSSHNSHIRSLQLHRGPERGMAPPVSSGRSGLVGVRPLARDTAHGTIAPKPPAQKSVNAAPGLSGAKAGKAVSEAQQAGSSISTRCMRMWVCSCLWIAVLPCACFQSGAAGRVKTNAAGFASPGRAWSAGHETRGCARHATPAPTPQQRPVNEAHDADFSADEEARRRAEAAVVRYVPVRRHIMPSCRTHASLACAYHCVTTYRHLHAFATRFYAASTMR
jgi:hypothetical protein